MDATESVTVTIPISQLAPHIMLLSDEYLKQLLIKYVIVTQDRSLCIIRMENKVIRSYSFDISLTDVMSSGCRPYFHTCPMTPDEVKSLVTNSSMFISKDQFFITSFPLDN